MKKVISYLVSYVVFFAICVSCGIEQKSDIIYSANPNVTGLGDNVSLFTGKSTANPALNYEAKTSNDCVVCHFAESINIASSKHNDNKEFKGELCTTCHGTNGDKHYSKIYLTPEDCGVCHIKSEVNTNPLNKDFIKNFISSDHAKFTNSDKFLDKAKEEGYLKTFNGQTFLVSKGGCLNCHENISFQSFMADKEYFMKASGEKVFANNFMADNLSIGLSVVKGENKFIGMNCSTCHDMHNGGLTKKDEYTLCTSCHVVDESELAKLDDKHRKDSKTIGDTHFAKNGVGGYNIDVTSVRACSLCHDSHASTSFDDRAVELTKEFAKSGMADYKSEAFNHDFEQECMKCHSGYEAAKYFEGAKLESLDNITKSVTLGCVTCHSLTEKPLFGIFGYRLGEVREAKSDNFTFPFMADEKLDIISKDNIKKIGDSQICLNCHSGVNSARIVNKDVLNKPFNHKESIHGYAAAGIFWGNIAYEFAGKNYYQATFPQHAVSRISKGGLLLSDEQVAEKEITIIESCNDCHEVDRFSHTFDTVNVDDNGSITGINMTESKAKKGCNEPACHGEDGLKHGGKAEANRKGYIKALNEVSNKLLKRGIMFNKEEERFVIADDPDTDFTNWTEELYGVASNYFLLANCGDGAYSHNPIYVKQILWDMMTYLGGEFSTEAKMFVNNTRP